ncbi:MAG: cohesin domain-containing protein [Nitrospirota bacterium]
MKTSKITLILLCILIIPAQAYATAVSMPDLNADPLAAVNVPVNVDDGAGLAGYQFTVTYDAAVLACTGAQKGSLTQGWDTPTVNATIPGQITVLSIDPNLVELGSGGGSLVILVCTAADNPGGTTSLHFDVVAVSDGEGNPVPATSDDGSLTINGGCVPIGPDINCDGVDDDCDGIPDDEYVPIPTTCGIGACAATGESVCVNGQLVDSCMPGTPGTEGPIGDATCNDAVDNDCDGFTDGSDTDCGGECIPSAEVCDGIDNDCDEEIDEDIAPVPTSCGLGACAATGELTCVGGQMTDNCTPGTGSAELCNNIDDDCDGQIDEDITPVPTTCGVGACMRAGQAACTEGQWSDDCIPGIPGAETCNLIDDDCNGNIDDHMPPLQTTCGTGACRATGQTTCIAGQMVDDCIPGIPVSETCNGLDDDCNGTIDDNIEMTPTTCGVGACAATGWKTCVSGEMTDSCTPLTAGTEGPFPDNSCADQLDNDCDGATDSEDPDCIQQCIPSAEVCDGLDNDCDGVIDNGIAPVPTTCGVGACAATGQKVCENGQMTDTCTPAMPGREGQAGTSLDLTCSDQTDNDCDGATDASDPDCMAQQSPDLNLWVGTWFRIKAKTKCSTFLTPESAALFGPPGETFVKEQYVEDGYMHIWKWEQSTGSLEFDYYESAQGEWNAYTGALHFFAGTGTEFLFWYAGLDEALRTTMNGMIKGKVKDGYLKKAKIKTIGGFYTERQHGNALYSAGEQTINGNMITDPEVPVPYSVRLH